MLEIMRTRSISASRAASASASAAARAIIAGSWVSAGGTISRRFSRVMPSSESFILVPSVDDLRGTGQSG